MKRPILPALLAGLVLAQTPAVLYGPPQPLADLADSAVRESSGVAASARRPGVYWTHNDSGDAPRIYAFDSRGRALGRWVVTGARAADWEDIAAGPGPAKGTPYLYIGDIGDNSRGRKSVTVYRIVEPDARAARCPAQGCPTQPADALVLEYPDGAHDAEALLVHPRTGDLYIVTKALGDHETTTVFKAPAPLSPAKPVRLAKLAQLDIPERVFVSLVGGITGGGISPDGTRVALCDYLRAYEAIVPAGAEFDAVWKREFRPVPLGLGAQHEGICYRPDGRALIVTSEGRPCRASQLERSAGLQHGQ